TPSRVERKRVITKGALPSSIQSQGAVSRRERIGDEDVCRLAHRELTRSFAGDWCTRGCRDRSAVVIVRVVKIESSHEIQLVGIGDEFAGRAIGILSRHARRTDAPETARPKT